MSEIILENVNLDYPVYGSGPRFFAKRLVSLASAGMIHVNERYSFIRSLDDVTLIVKAGDRLALIGGNGAGKSSLLKIISGIYHPTRGKITIKGKVTPILGFGFGLDDSASGYENIILGGVALGYSVNYMKAKTKEIEDFTELGDFLNMPIKTYSSGMRARLAFAITTSTGSEILVMDEGIGAGDNAFFNKAQKKLESFLGMASILVIASHSTDLLKRFCNKGVVMKHGKLEFIGSLDDALTYNESGF
jgi:ABC-2 type transport system ATP-binding protein